MALLKSIAVKALLLSCIIPHLGAGKVHIFTAGVPDGKKADGQKAAYQSTTKTSATANKEGPQVEQVHTKQTVKVEHHAVRMDHVKHVVTTEHTTTKTTHPDAPSGGKSAPAQHHGATAGAVVHHEDNGATAGEAVHAHHGATAGAAVAHHEPQLHHGATAGAAVHDGATAGGVVHAHHGATAGAAVAHHEPEKHHHATAGAAVVHHEEEDQPHYEQTKGNKTGANVAYSVSSSRGPCIPHIELDIKLLEYNDSRLTSAPHISMEPAVFSSPAYFNKPCSIGSKDPTTKKCAAEMQAVKSLKAKITATMKRAQETGASVRNALHESYPHGLDLADGPLKSFVSCHCTNCSKTLTEIPDELFWREIWSIMGYAYKSHKPGQNLCELLASNQHYHHGATAGAAVHYEPQLHHGATGAAVHPGDQQKRVNRGEKIGLDDLFRKVWNTEMGKVYDEHMRTRKVQQTKKKQAKASGKGKKVGETTGGDDEQENSSTIFGFHPALVAIHVVGTMGAIIASFFVFMR